MDWGLSNMRMAALKKVSIQRSAIQVNPCHMLHSYIASSKKRAAAIIPVFKTIFENSHIHSIVLSVSDTKILLITANVFRMLSTYQANSPAFPCDN